jgi:ABC-type polysaccharide/polyol phosphate transport system ATPase subunit
LTDAIEICAVSKRFRRYPPRSRHTLKEALLTGELFRRLSGPRHIEVLRNISFNVPQGMTFGIVGRNGSGKSSLLKLMCGILKPTAGRIAVHGRIAALLNLGVGFHPHFSGRENVFINGLVLGLTPREIRERFDDIVGYAELEEFIDAPVRTYSAGMYVRLAFSVAINIDPDIILLDEVMAVGDQAFSRKCLNSLEDFKRRGKTIILVTHDPQSVATWCDRALWLSDGVIQCIGDPEEVLAQYQQRLGVVEEPPHVEKIAV